MMRRIRACDRGSRASRTASFARAAARFFPLFFALVTGLPPLGGEA
jgi:hypothetical protein